MGTIWQTPTRNFGAEGMCVAEEIIELHFRLTIARSSPSLGVEESYFRTNVVLSWSLRGIVPLFASNKGHN